MNERQIACDPTPSPALIESIENLDRGRHAVRKIGSAGRTLGVLDVDGRQDQSDGTYIMLLPWSEFTRRDNARDRYSVLASVLRQRVIAVDTPGVGPDATDLSTAEAHAVAGGDLRVASEQQLAVLDGMLHRDEAATLTVGGYSMGSGLAVSLLEHADAQAIHASKLILAEHIGHRVDRRINLVAKFGIEMARWQQYFQEAPDGVHPPGKDTTMYREMLQRRKGYWIYPFGLSSGCGLDSIQAARANGVLDADTQVVLATGSKSVISTPASNREFAEDIEATTDMNANLLILDDMTHGALDSLPRYVASQQAAVEAR